jgi:hypothetical protein
VEADPSPYTLPGCGGLAGALATPGCGGSAGALATPGCEGFAGGAGHTGCGGSAEAVATPGFGGSAGALATPGCGGLAGALATTWCGGAPVGAAAGDASRARASGALASDGTPTSPTPGRTVDAAPSLAPSSALEVMITLTLRLRPVDRARLERLIEALRQRGHREGRDQPILASISSSRAPRASA